jgi:hypothetical protein
MFRQVNNLYITVVVPHNVRFFAIGTTLHKEDVVIGDPDSGVGGVVVECAGVKSSDQRVVQYRVHHCRVSPVVFILSSK